MSDARPRSEVPPGDQWNLEPLYPNTEAWETDYADAQALPERVAAFAGRLGEADTVLAQALSTWFDASRRMEKLYVYAHLTNDQDLDNGSFQGLYDRARSLFTALLSAGAFLGPEILAIDDETMARWLKGEALAPYTFWLRDLLRAKPHTLSAPEERLLAMVSEPLAALQRAYSVLKNVEVSARLPQVTDADGQARRLSHASFIELQESPDRDVRRAAFDAYYREWAGNRATAAATLDGAVKAHIFEARARRHPSALAAALFEDNVDTSVYDALISAVHDALPAFYRYMALRKRLLGVDTLHMYDNYVSVLPEVAMRHTYDEAVEVVLRGLAPLGQEYLDTARGGLTGGWVDRYENAGKRSGAYSSGCYDSWPYMLMNYTGTLDSVFTLAHELGHSMHSLYSNRAQPYHLADYRILVAEVASTTNEALLNHHLMETTQDRTARAYLVDRYLDSFRATLFRQTMFAEFEKRVHEQAEAGQPLTKDWLDSTYYDLVRLYFGDTVAFDAQDAPIAYEWARVDHFYYFFYVYKYATGMAAAVAIAAAIQRGEPGALERYLAFLQSGGSDYPLEQLQRAGVDLTTPEPVSSALGEFDRLVGLLEDLLA